MQQRSDWGRRAGRIGWRDILADTTGLERLALGVLFVCVLYSVVGVPEFSREHLMTAEVDAVSPLNRWIWLGLLALAMPLIVRGRAALGALLVASWPLLLLFALFAASTQWALDPAASMRRFIAGVVQLAIYAGVVATVRRPALLHITVVAAFVALAAIDAGVGVAMPGFAMMQDGFAGIHTQKNQTGLALMLGCIATGSGLFLPTRTLARIALAAALAVMLAMLALTRSETSIAMVLMCAALGPLLVSLRPLPRATVRALVALPVLAAIAGLVAYLAVCAVGGRDPMAPLAGVTFSMRTDLWDFTLSEIAQRPMLGAGFGSFWAIDPAVQPSLRYDSWFTGAVKINEAHNGYLDLLAANGLVGLALGLLALGRALRHAVEAVAASKPARVAWLDGAVARPTAIFQLLMILAFLVHNMMESELFNTAFLSWFMIFVMLDIENARTARRARAGAWVMRPSRPPLPSGAPAPDAPRSAPSASTSAPSA